MTADRYIAWGKAYETPDDHRWYAVGWSSDDGPTTVETLHAEPRDAYLAARRLAAAEGLDCEYCDEYGPVGGGWVAALGMAGWGIRHARDPVFISDGYDTAADAWQAAEIAVPEADDE